MASTKAVTRGDFDRLCGDVKEIEEWKDGNGKLGAKVTLSLMEERWGVMEKKIDRVFNALVGLLITILAGLALWFFTNYLPNHI